MCAHTSIGPAGAGDRRATLVGYIALPIGNDTTPHTAAAAASPAQHASEYTAAKMQRNQRGVLDDPRLGGGGAVVAPASCAAICMLCIVSGFCRTTTHQTRSDRDQTSECTAADQHGHTHTLYYSSSSSSKMLKNVIYFISFAKNHLQ